MHYFPLSVALLLITIIASATSTICNNVLGQRVRFLFSFPLQSNSFVSFTPPFKNNNEKHR